MAINVVEFVVRRGGTAVHGVAYTKMVKTDDIQAALEKEVCVVGIDKVEIKLVRGKDALILTPSS